MPTATNVTTGKPRTAGGVYRAPIGTTLPTDSNTTLSSDFKNLGYLAEDGVTNSNSPETENLRAWGGTVVLTVQTGKDDTFAFGLIESLNPEVPKAVYGDSNVSGDLTTGLTIRANSEDTGEAIYVIDMVQRGGVLRRIVIPNGKITEVGDIVYADNDAVSYPVTITAQAGADGDTHKEYLIKP